MSASEDIPLFSVIMPVHNHAGYVREGAESVIGQMETDWELILVDDGSTDGSAAIPDDRICAIHQPNAGPAAARNAALAGARAGWLAYIDSDLPPENRSGFCVRVCVGSRCLQSATECRRT